MTFLNASALALFGVAITLDARLGATTSLLGSDVINPTSLAVVATAAVGLVISPNRSSGLGAITIGPLLWALLILPILGVILADYPITTIYALITPLLALSLIRVGRISGSLAPWADRIIILAIAAHAGYGIGQTAYRSGMLPPSFWGWAARWDANAQTAFGDAYIQSGRSTGLFLNPNSFALWGATGMIYSMFYLTGYKRSAAIALSVASIVSSQSRTGLVALVLIAGIAALRLTKLRTAQISPSAFLAGLALAAVTFIFGGRLLHFFLDESLGTRVSSGLAVVTGGAAADENLYARLAAWSQLLDDAQAYPVGTLGPPQLRVDSLIDNQFLVFYLQGGLLLVALFVWALTGPWRISPHLDEHDRSALKSMVGIVTIFSMTAPAVTGSVLTTSLVWFVVGRATCNGRAPTLSDRQLAANSKSEA